MKRPPTERQIVPPFFRLDPETGLPDFDVIPTTDTVDLIEIPPCPCCGENMHQCDQSGRWKCYCSTTAINFLEDIVAA